ncbi:MAG TPA: hypothetical protein PLH56_01515 [Candidatus Omnitrophota bacterium]|nr:hypothetical protein [Candidatus Omnitrophota bacterium]HPN87995.1 hypothetical protein [Candidatus Omnitrophota bacterium]
MKTKKCSIKIFKIKNRKGFAAICCDCLTEGKTKQEAVARMAKALKRVTKKAKRK